MLMVEPTIACQLACPHCPTGRGEITRPHGRMTYEQFRRIWTSIKPSPLLLQLWNQGEPLMNAEIFPMITLAARSGSWVTLATNVELLNNEQLALELVESGLYELILSLDGATPESHAAYRKGGSFENVRQGIRNVVAGKQRLRSKTPKLTWQFLLFRHNLEEVKSAKRLAREWGVDRIVFKTAQLENRAREEGETWLPDDPHLRRYDLVNDRWILRRSASFFCKRLFSSAVVLWNGDVVPCCFDKDGKYIMGNTLQNGFKEVWKSAKFQEFRKNWIPRRRPLICENCTEGLRKLYVKL